MSLMDVNLKEGSGEPRPGLSSIPELSDDTGEPVRFWFRHLFGEINWYAGCKRGTGAELHVHAFGDEVQKKTLFNRG